MGLGLSACKSKTPPEARYADARVQFQQGNIDVAINLADQSYRDFESRDPNWSWKFRILEADMLLWRGEPTQTLALLAGSLPGKSPAEITIRRAILRGRALCRLGQPESEAMLHEAEVSASSSERSLRAELAFAHGKCSADPVTARAFYRQTADMAHGIDAFDEANALIYIGYFELQDRHYKEAIDRFREALALTGPFRLLEEKALGNLGYAYSQIGEFRRAIDKSTDAANLASELAHVNQQEKWIKIDQVKWLIDLGRERFTQLEYPEAEASFDQALTIAREFRDLENTAICLNNLAQLALRTNALAKAENYTRQLEDLKPTGGHYLDLLLNQAELAKARLNFSEAETVLLHLLEQMPSDQSMDPTVRWTAQSDLAAVYEAQKKFDIAENMFRQAVKTAESGWSKTKEVEHRISFLDQAPFYDRYVKFLVSRNRPIEALDVAELGRSPTLSGGLSPGERKSLRGVRFRSIQETLRARGGVVLAYWLGWEGQESYLWAITPSAVRLFRLPAEADIERRVEAYNREVREGGAPERSRIGQELYQILVYPAQALIPKGSSVIIVPHRKLHNFNFETLIVPGPSPHYWIEDAHVQNVSFLGAVTSPEHRLRRETLKELLIVGAPLQADKRFPVLQQAATEMEKVAQHFTAAQAMVLAGRDATPQAYLASAPGQFRLLHFVTHGTSSTALENPLDSAIILSPIEGHPVSSADPQESYMLFGKEIMNTPLHADLVTVSACYGVGREYSGEGMVGLAWAFMRAGAHQVVAALWEVDDASTPQLMDDFYGELSEGKSAAEALRTAKLKMLHGGGARSRPYYWASLQLYTGS